MEKKIELISEVKELFEDWRPKEEKVSKLDSDSILTTQGKVDREIKRLEVMQEVLSVDLMQMNNNELLSTQLSQLKEENEELYTKLHQRSKVSDSTIMCFLERIWLCQN